ncbi:MAG: hypothetical protein LBG87_09680 [Spirochaetaceae bacterium]|jgi:hypothetical protein|nr:hypothetical protein [Spirochaetaceae bacterium]
MKYKHGLIFGFAGIFLAAIFSFSACAKDDDDDPPAGKSLTVTGLGNYNGKYATATASSPMIFATASIDASSSTITYVQIADGKVTLPLWIVSESGISAYDGADTVSMQLMITTERTATMGGGSNPTVIAMAGLENVNLGASNPTVAVAASDIVEP